jgi:hypothetical protein
MDYRIGKFLDTSTETITEEDMKILETHQETPTDIADGRGTRLHVRVIPHTYGWWINVQHGDDDCLQEALASISDNGFSEQFKQLFQAAVDNACDWINIDRDA